MSKPRTARLERIRSTMLGSSSTIRTRVRGASAVVASAAQTSTVLGAAPCAGRPSSGCSTGRRIAKRVPGRARLELDLPAVGLDDAARDRQAEAGARGRRCAARRRPAQRRGDVVAACRRRRRSTLTTTSPSPLVARLDAHARPRRVVAEGVLEQVDEDLLEPVVVGPDRPAARARSSTVTRAASAGGRQAIAASSTSVRSHQSGAAAASRTRSPRSRAGRRRGGPSRADSAAMRLRKRCSESPSQVTSGCHQARRVAADRRQRRAQLVAQAREEAALELLRAAQRRGLLARALGLLALVREAQRVGGVLEQRGRVGRRGAAQPSARAARSARRAPGR